MRNLKHLVLFVASLTLLLGGFGVTTVQAKPKKATVKKAVAKKAHKKAVKRFKAAKKLAKKLKKDAKKKGKFLKSGGHLVVAKKKFKKDKFKKSVAHSRRAHKLATKFIKANGGKLKKDNDLSASDCDDVPEAEDDGVDDAEPSEGDLEDLY